MPAEKIHAVTLGHLWPPEKRYGSAFSGVPGAANGPDRTGAGACQSRPASCGLGRAARPPAQSLPTSVADLGIRARIADAAKFRALAYQAIGNHRSYGLGSVSAMRWRLRRPAWLT